MMRDDIAPCGPDGSSAGSLDDRIRLVGAAILRAEDRKPAYSEFYPFLGNLFLAQERSRSALALERLAPDPVRAHARWAEGLPLLKRWEFPVSVGLAEELRRELGKYIPGDNLELRVAFAELSSAQYNHRKEAEEIWRSFLRHEGEPWERWIDTQGVDTASLLFLARSCLRPSVEWTATDLLRRVPPPDDWLRGHCPVCGSMPALLVLQGEGGRKGYCSWCGTSWALNRIQCPCCDNRDHESMGYLMAEEDPLYRVQYCRLCRCYFKMIDLRESADSPYLPLEEWTTLHLDLLARQRGWNAPPSPSPAVYGPLE